LPGAVQIAGDATGQLGCRVIEQQDLFEIAADTLRDGLIITDADCKTRRPVALPHTRMNLLDWRPVAR
jgi:hypothetical protein